MTTFSGRSVRRAALVAGSALLALAVAGCSDDADPASSEPTSSKPALSSLGALDGLTMIDTSWASFHTAKVTAVAGSPRSRAVNVTYETTGADCAALAGFAEHRTDKSVEVTIVIGAEERCEPGKATTATTVVPLTEPLGTAKPTASAYSKQSIDIG